MGGLIARNKTALRSFAATRGGPLTTAMLACCSLDTTLPACHGGPRSTDLVVNFSRYSRQIKFATSAKILANLERALWAMLLQVYYSLSMSQLNCLSPKLLLSWLRRLGLQSTQMSSGAQRDWWKTMVKRVCVLGLSDIGRSPRLQNHAISLSRQVGLLVKDSNKAQTLSRVWSVAYTWWAWCSKAQDFVRGGCNSQTSTSAVKCLIRLGKAICPGLLQISNAVYRPNFLWTWLDTAAARLCQHSHKIAESTYTMCLTCEPHESMLPAFSQLKLLIALRKRSAHEWAQE